MMYNQKLVASVRSNGKIMREHGDVVFLPFGEEYTILLKNMNSQRALVKIEIDGEEVIPGGLVINSQETVDLERFVLEGDLNKGPKFKFIEKTAQISDHRGDKIEDGVLRISYRYEAVVPSITYTYNHNPWDSGYDPMRYRVGGTSTRGITKGSHSVDGDVTNTYFSSASVGASTNTLTASVNLDAAQNQDGITVHGEDSTQKFRTTSMGLLEAQEHVICLHLRGQVDGQTVNAPVTVSRKINCDTCGKSNKTSNKFCGGCGTNLTYQY